MWCAWEWNDEILWEWLYIYIYLYVVCCETGIYFILWLLTPCVCLCVGWMPCLFQVIRESPMSEREGLSWEDTCSDSVTLGRGIYIFMNYCQTFNFWNLDFIMMLEFLNYEILRCMWTFYLEKLIIKSYFMRFLLYNYFGVEGVTVRRASTVDQITSKTRWL